MVECIFVVGRIVRLVRYSKGPVSTLAFFLEGLGLDLVVDGRYAA